MIKISGEQLARIDQKFFYSRLEGFIAARCRNQKLMNLLSEREKLHSIWSTHWPRARKLSEHDCALFLVLLAVCECEGVALTPVDAMLDYLPTQEVQVKQFISGRGYFRFSDFDFVNAAAEGGQNA